MSIYSFVQGRIEDGSWTGVPRFDYLLRRTLPGLQSVTKCPEDLTRKDRVITDNHLSLQVPDHVRTIVVHHGCAAVHFSRDISWRNENTATMAMLQDDMFKRPNRCYVAPSAWVAKAFEEWHKLKDYRATIIPHFVERISRVKNVARRPVIIGDWRDPNKGSEIFRKLQARMIKEWDLHPLNFRSAAGRIEQYSQASLYLCLSQSEGGAFAVCDAEAAELPIVTTDVGNYLEFDDCEVIDWQMRDRLEYVIQAIERKLRKGRTKASFYANYTFEEFRRRWQQVIQ